MQQFRLTDVNTRFALPIICPTTGEQVSAETLYNRCCDAMGHVLRDHIGDLIFDNLNYSTDETVCATDASNEALHDAVMGWANSVRKQLNTIKRPEGEQQ